MSIDLFPDTAAPADPLLGAAICMSERCRVCGTNVAVVCAARGSHTAGLKCRNCDAQWTADIDFQSLRAAIAEITSHFGAPAEIKLTTIKQRSNAMAYEQRDNTGTLFRNEDKDPDNEKDRDYQGSITVGGVEYWLSAWIKEGKRGKFMSLAAKRKEAPKEVAKTSRAQDMSDEIPF